MNSRPQRREDALGGVRGASKVSVTEVRQIGVLLRTQCCDRLGKVISMGDALRHKVLLERNDQGGFTATVPAFPAIVTQGDTQGEALANAVDAIHLYVDSPRSRSLPVPCART